MMRSTVFLVAFVTLGCGDSGGTSGTSSVTATATDASTSAPSASGVIGVAECDEYVRRMRDCIANAPAEERAARVKALDDIEATWKRQAASADTKERMVTSCRASLTGLDASPACKGSSGAAGSASATVEDPTLSK